MDGSLHAKILRAIKRNDHEVWNQVRCVRNLLRSSNELSYATNFQRGLSPCGFYSLARSHQTIPELRTTRNRLCQRPTLPTDISCRLYLKSFLSLEFLQDQVGCYFRNKTKGGGGTFQLLLCFLCNVLPALLLTVSQVVFQKGISRTAHLSQRGNCFFKLV